MDMYVNPSEHAIQHQTTEINLSRQKQPVLTKSSNLESHYIGKNNIVVREPEEFYSPLMGEVSGGLIAGGGYNTGFPATDAGTRNAMESVLMPNAEKPSSLKQKASTGDTGSSALGSPFPGTLFEAGASDGITLGGSDGINLGGGGGALTSSISRVNTRRYERIDRIAMKLFPIIFILFNVCYWSYYLLLHETFQELW